MKLPLATSGLIALAIALAVAPAHADDKKRAAVHLKQGAAYYKAEQYDAAIAEFEKSYALDARPQTLFNIANAFYKKGDHAKAIEYFQRYLTADPDGKYAPQALEFSAIAKKELAELEAKRKAAEAAERAAAQQKRLAAEQERTRVEVAAKIKQAEAFEQAGAWASAGDEYRALGEGAGAPEHLLLAAEAYHKQPALDRARDAYRAYLDKVPMGGKSDHARAQLASITSELDRARAGKAGADGTPRPAAAAVTRSAASAPDRSHRLSILATWLLWPPGMFNGTGFQTADSQNKILGIEELGYGLDLGASYAIGGGHTVTSAYSRIMSLHFIDDEQPVSRYAGHGHRFTAGYRYVTRRGSMIRPAFGAHASHLRITIDHQQGDQLLEPALAGFGLELELGVMIEAPHHILLHLFWRPLDVVGVIGKEGLVMMQLGLGVGAHL